MSYSAFYFASHFIILLTAHLLARHSIRSGPQFISLISLVTSCQLPYHTEIRCLSKLTFIPATDGPHMTVKQTATLHLFSNEIWVNLREYVYSKDNMYSAVNSM